MLNVHTIPELALEFLVAEAVELNRYVAKQVKNELAPPPAPKAHMCNSKLVRLLDPVHDCNMQDFKMNNSSSNILKNSLLQTIFLTLRDGISLRDSISQVDLLS